MDLTSVIKKLPIREEEFSQSDDELPNIYEELPLNYKKLPTFIPESAIEDFFQKIKNKYEKYKNIKKFFINFDNQIINLLINFILNKNLDYVSDSYIDDYFYNIILYDIIIYFVTFNYRDIIEYNIIKRTDIFENLNKSGNYNSLNIPSEIIKNFNIKKTTDMENIKKTTDVENIKKITYVKDKKKFIYLYYIMVYKLCCLDLYKENDCNPLFNDILSLSYDLDFFDEKEYEYFIKLNFKIDFSYFKVRGNRDHFIEEGSFFIKKYNLFDDEEFKSEFLDLKIPEREKIINGHRCYFISYAEFLNKYIKTMIFKVYQKDLTNNKEDILRDNKSFYKIYPDENAENFHLESANNDYLFLLVRVLLNLNSPDLRNFYNKIIGMNELKYIPSNIEVNYRFYLTFGILAILPQNRIEYPDKNVLNNIIKILSKYNVNFALCFPLINNIKIVNVYELIFALVISIIGNPENYYIMLYNFNHMLNFNKIIKKSNIIDELIEQNFNKVFFEINIELVKDFDKYKNKHLILIFYLSILGIDISMVKYLIGFLFYSGEMNLTNYNKNLFFIDEFKNYIIYNIVSFRDDYIFDDEIYNNEYFTKSNKDSVVDTVPLGDTKLISLISLIEISAGIEYNFEIMFSKRKEKLIKHFIKYFNKLKKPKEYDYLIKRIFPKFNDAVLSNISDYYYKNITIYI